MHTTRGHSSDHTTSRRTPARARRTGLTGLVGLTVAALLTASGCSGGQGEPGPGGEGPRTRGIDARALYEDYDSSSEEDTGLIERFFGGGTASDQRAGAPAPTGTPGGEALESQGDGPTDVLPPQPPDIDEDNTFVEAGTAGFTATEDDPRSTFAMDVDTGSWNVARTLMTQGQRPPAASIRVEEWINALPVDDPAPTGEDLAVRSTSATSAALPDTQVTRIGVTARELALSDLPPVNVSLVVDRSGSMDIRERLGLVQSSLALLADSLRASDTVSVVSFDDRVETVLEPTPVGETGTILDAVRELTPGGSTNLAAGLERGYELAREAYRPDGVNVVVLASDGVANVGLTGPEAITGRIAEEGRDGIHLVTVGYGMGNYNDHLMEQLADTGDGFYAYVDDFTEARQLFVEDLASTLAPVAAEARTQVELDPELVTSYRQVGYDNRQLADSDFRDDSVDAGEIGAGHRTSALYELQLADGVRPGTEVGTVTVRWTPVGGGAAREVSTPVLATAGPDVDAVELSTGGVEGADRGRLAVTAAAADLAGLLKGGPVYASRAVTLVDVRDRARALVEADVAGAPELLEMVDLALATGPGAAG